MMGIFIAAGSRILNLFSALYKFVNGEIGLRAGVVRKMVEQLKEIATWFEDQKKYNFYASSIFLSYDSNDLKPFVPRAATHELEAEDHLTASSLDAGRTTVMEGTDHEGTEGLEEPDDVSRTGEKELKVRVRMIDFDHALPTAQKDDNYLDALKRLIKVFENLRTLYLNPALLEFMFPITYITDVTPPDAVPLDHPTA